MTIASNRRPRGFTLIEMLIVMVVLGILAAIAIPTYRDYVVRSNRSEAIVTLSELANLEEKFFSNELRYTGTIGLLSYPSISPNNLYGLSITTNTTVAYTLTAVPRGQQLQDDDTCQQFTLNSFGQRSATDSGGGNTTQTCWAR